MNVKKREHWCYWPKGDKEPLTRLYRFDIERCITETGTFWRYIGSERKLSEAEISDMIQSARTGIARLKKSNY